MAAHVPGLALFTASKRFGHFITTDGASVSVNIAHCKVQSGGSNNNSNKKQKSKSRLRNRPAPVPSALPRAGPGLSADERGTLAQFAKDTPLQIVGIDPGKRNLIYATNHAHHVGKKNGIRLRYTYAQRQHESGAPTRAKKLNKRKTPRILELERRLAAHNSRTTYLAKFQAYLATRFAVQQELLAHYCKPWHRIARWYNWRGRRKSEDKFVQKVLDTFAPPSPPRRPRRRRRPRRGPRRRSPPPAAAAPPAPAPAPAAAPPVPAPASATAVQRRVVIAYGDGFGFHALRWSPPSPTTGLRRRFLAKAHQGLVVIDTQEYGTSKKCSRCKHDTMVEDPSRTRPVTTVTGYDDHEGIQVGNHIRVQTRVPLWASTAATAISAEVAVGIVITTLPSTSETICCTTSKVVHGQIVFHHPAKKRDRLGTMFGPVVQSLIDH